VEDKMTMKNETRLKILALTKLIIKHPIGGVWQHGILKKCCIRWEANATCRRWWESWSNFWL